MGTFAQSDMQRAFAVRQMLVRGRTISSIAQTLACRLLLSAAELHHPCEAIASTV